MQNFRHRPSAVACTAEIVTEPSSRARVSDRLKRFRRRSEESLMRIAAVVLALALVSPALAQTAPAPAPPPEGTPSAKTQDQLKSTGDYTLPMQPRGRYSYAPVDEGFLRFDHKDGEVALCKPGPSSWSCEAVEDKTAPVRLKEQADNEKILQALRDDIAGLKKDVAALRAPPPLPP